MRDEEFIPYSSWEPDQPWDPRDDGRVIALISRELSGSKDLNVGIGRISPGEYHIKHHHPEGSEFYFFLSGECRVWLDDQQVVARRGTSIYIPPGCVHAIRNDGTEPSDLIYGLSRPEYPEIGLIYDE
jgi:mannose-6-phosphate isomerase-like protein (cupin superfamily)